MFEPYNSLATKPSLRISCQLLYYLRLLSHLLKQAFVQQIPLSI